MYQQLRQSWNVTANSGVGLTSNNREYYPVAVFFLLTGIIKAKQLDYSEAHKNLIQAIRKAPQFSAIGFRQIVSSWDVKFCVGGGGDYVVLPPLVNAKLFLPIYCGKISRPVCCQYLLVNFIALHIRNWMEAKNGSIDVHVMVENNLENAVWGGRLRSLASGWELSVWEP